MIKRNLIWVTFAVLITTALAICNGGSAAYSLYTGSQALLAVWILCMIVRMAVRSKKRSGAFSRHYSIKMTAATMALLFVTDNLFYLLIFKEIESPYYPSNNTELFFRSMICALDMFMLDIDSNILDRLKEFPRWKGAIEVMGALSFGSTIAMLGSLVYSRAKAYYDLHFKSKVTDSRNHIYLFFGIDENSRILAEDIKTNDQKAMKIFVVEENMDENENDSWSNIVRLFTHRQSTFEYATKSDSLVAIASEQLCDLDKDQIKKWESDILSMVGLSKVKNLILKLKETRDYALHIFFLSNDEDRNIKNLTGLAKDATISAIATDVKRKRDKDNKLKEDVYLKLYCHARYNGPNRVIEDLAVKKNLDVEIVDSSHIAVELLKSREDSQPIRVASISNEDPTLVTKPLESLIIGFGEVGRDAFRFIYEFGTFLQKKDHRLQAARPMITAVDARMKLLDGVFKSNTPGIDWQDGNLKFLNIDCREEAFYNQCLSPEHCRTLNYIVIALGNDDHNISLAVNIFSKIRQNRGDISDVIIMTRCVDHNNRQMMQKIADHYNKGCADLSSDVIRLFGDAGEVYTYSTIIHDELLKKGKSYLDSYNIISKDPDPKDWDQRRALATAIGVNGHPDIDKLRSLRRKESQDLANALHASTKMWILEKALIRLNEKELNQEEKIKADAERRTLTMKYFSDLKSLMFDKDGVVIREGNGKKIVYPRFYNPNKEMEEDELGKDRSRIMLHLAMLEHLRWNAAHELLGYSVNDHEVRCNERIRRHNCLRDWEELDAQSELTKATPYPQDYKGFDFSVVETSIFLHYSTLLKKQKEATVSH